MTEQTKVLLSRILFIAVAVLGAAGIVIALLIPAGNVLPPEEEPSSVEETEEYSASGSEEITEESSTEETSSEEDTEEPTIEEPTIEEPTFDHPTEPIMETKEIEIPETLNMNAVNIWVGDSRMVGIANSGIGDPVKDVFIAKGAMAFDWFDCRGNYRNNGAMTRLKPYLDTGKDLNVIIQMGINDCANNEVGWSAYSVSDYIVRINQLAAGYPNAHFYFISVGRDVGYYGGAYGRLIHPRNINPRATDFNCRMFNDCMATYLAVGEAIARMNVGKGPGVGGYADGVHYNNATNRWIYRYVLDHIESGVSDMFEPYPEEGEPFPSSSETDDETETGTDDETGTGTDDETGTGTDDETGTGTDDESGSESGSESESESGTADEGSTDPSVSDPEETVTESGSAETSDPETAIGTDAESIEPPPETGSSAAD